MFIIIIIIAIIIIIIIVIGSNSNSTNSNNNSNKCPGRSWFLRGLSSGESTASLHLGVGLDTVTQNRHCLARLVDRWSWTDCWLDLSLEGRRALECSSLFNGSTCSNDGVTDYSPKP